MKKKALSAVFAALAATCVCAGFSACGKTDAGSGENEKISEIYASYVAHAEENGDTPLSYEEWLKSIKGEKGEKGDKGDPGAQGEKGADGIDGKDGEKGKDGKDGKSAYEIWLEQGHTGSEEDFLEWIKSAQPSGESKLAFKTLKTDGFSANGIVSNATEEFSFKDEITASGNAKYTVALDKYGIYQSATKIVPLKAGDNQFYIFETLDEEIVKTYTIKIRRRPMYTVSFNSDGGSEVQSQQVEEDSFAAEPAAPDKVGYTFEKWGYNFAQAVTEDTEITAQWKINQYTLTIVFGNGKPDTIIKQNYNAKLEIPDPERGGYDFLGWDQEIPETMPAEDVTRTAKWAAIFTLSETGETITGLTEYGKNNCAKLIIPAEIEGVKITAIGRYAFENCRGFESITIPDNITAIGEGAFSNCFFLHSVYITDLEKWCKISFGGFSANPLSCASNLYVNNELVTKLVIPDSVKSIGALAFNYCSGLTSVMIPDSVESIDALAFSGCIGLTSVTIGKGLEFIGDGAFDSCYRLEKISVATGNSKYHSEGNCLVETETKTLILGCRNSVIPADGSVTSIGDYAFENCRGFESITIPDCVITIGNGAFRNCSSLTDVTIGNSVETIGGSAFSGCSSLTIVTIPDSVETIDDGAFSGCGRLENVTIGNGVKTIGSFAFWLCDGLTSITIGNSVETIGAAFAGCGKLEKISVAAGNSKYHSAGNCLIETETKALIWGCKNSIIPADGSVTSIGGGSFYGCSGLTSIEMPVSVTSIGDSAFYDCSGLTSVTIPDSVTSIGVGAFSGCSSLTSITIPNSVTSIGDSAFYDCSGLTSVTIGKGVEFIGDGAFADCGKLEKISVAAGNSKYHSAGDCLIETETKTLIFGCKNSIIPADGSVTSIGDYAFSGCSGLTSIEIPNSIISIGGGSFYGCSGLTSIEMPVSVTSIGDSAFYDCSGLTSVTIPDSVTSIGEWAFRDCSGLTYHIKDNLMYLGNGTTPCLYLAGPVNNDITTMQIAETCRFIEKSAFYGCSKLEKISVAAGNSKYHSAGDCLVETETKTLILGCKNSIIPVDGSVTSIGEYAFYGCSGLTSITIGNSVTSIGEYAFSGCSTLTSITIPDSVTFIGRGAFSSCHGLISVIIGNSVASIGEYVFTDCDSLTNIIIPDSVTSIGGQAFSGCTWLDKVYYCGTAEDWNKISIDDNGNNDNLTSATRYYYSETQPTESGNFWHYNKNGEIEEWQ